MPRPSAYVASSSAPESIERVRAFQRRLVDLGFAIALDWTSLIDDARAAGYASDAAVPPEMALAHAQADWTAATTSAVFVYLQPPEKSEGAAFELGSAVTAYRCAPIGRGPATVLVVASQPKMFPRLAEKIVATEDEAIAYLRGLYADYLGAMERAR